MQKGIIIPTFFVLENEPKNKVGFVFQAIIFKILADKLI